MSADDIQKTVFFEEGLGRSQHVYANRITSRGRNEEDSLSKIALQDFLVRGFVCSVSIRMRNGLVSLRMSSSYQF